MLAIRVLVGVAIALGSYTALRGADLPILEVEAQPMKAQAKRVAAALQFLGQPLTQQQQQALDAAVAESDANQATNAIQKLFEFKFSDTRKPPKGCPRNQMLTIPVISYIP